MELLCNVPSSYFFPQKNCVYVQNSIEISVYKMIWGPLCPTMSIMSWLHLWAAVSPEGIFSRNHFLPLSSFSAIPHMWSLARPSREYYLPVIRTFNYKVSDTPNRVGNAFKPRLPFPRSAAIHSKSLHHCWGEEEGTKLSEPCPEIYTHA